MKPDVGFVRPMEENTSNMTLVERNQYKQKLKLEFAQLKKKEQLYEAKRKELIELEL